MRERNINRIVVGIIIALIYWYAYYMEFEFMLWLAIFGVMIWIFISSLEKVEKKDRVENEYEIRIHTIGGLSTFIYKHKSELNEKEVAYFEYKKKEYEESPSLAKEDDLIKYGNFVIRNMKVGK